MTRHIFPACQVADKNIVFPRAVFGQMHFANRRTDYHAEDLALLQQTCELIAPELDARIRSYAE